METLFWTIAVVLLFVFFWRQILGFIVIAGIAFWAVMLAGFGFFIFIVGAVAAAFDKRF